LRTVVRNDVINSDACIGVMLRYVRSSFQQDFVIIITLSAIVISRVVPSFHPSQRKEFCLSRMGIVFGKTGVEEPAFRVIARAPTYEV